MFSYNFYLPSNGGFSLGSWVGKGGGEKHKLSSWLMKKAWIWGSDDRIPESNYADELNCTLPENLPAASKTPEPGMPFLFKPHSGFNLPRNLLRQTPHGTSCSLQASFLTDKLVSSKSKVRVFTFIVLFPRLYWRNLKKMVCQLLWLAKFPTYKSVVSVPRGKVGG